MLCSISFLSHAFQIHINRQGLNSFLRNALNHTIILSGSQMIPRRCVPIFLLFTYWRIPHPGDQMKQTCIFLGFHLWNCSFLDFHNYYLPSLVSFLQLYVVPGPAAQPCRETQTVSPQNAMFWKQGKLRQRWQTSKKCPAGPIVQSHISWRGITDWQSVCVGPRLSVCLPACPFPLTTI